MDDADAVREFVGNIDLVGAQEDGHAGAGPLTKQVLHHPRVVRIQPDHGFIDDEHLRLVAGRWRWRRGWRVPWLSPSIGLCSHSPR